MAKARARSAARRVKDKWKAKNWYQILAPPLFDNVPVSETLADRPNALINRVTEVSLQDLTNDFRKSHIKLFFKISEIEGGNAHTQYIGHTLTSDYLRRMIRRRRSRVDGVYDITTQDGAYVRVKPFASTDKRIQNSQKRIIRESMKKTIENEGKTKTLNEFIRDALDGKIGSAIYKDCKNLYPVRRIDIHKTEVIRQPTMIIEDKKPAKKEETEETKDTEVKKPKTKKKETVKKTDETPKEELKTTEKPKPKVTKEKVVKKPAKKTPAKKTTTKAKATPKKKTPAKKTAAKAKTATKKKTTKVKKTK